MRLLLVLLLVGGVVSQSYNPPQRRQLLKTIASFNDKETVLHLQENVQKFLTKHPYFTNAWSGDLLRNGAFENLMADEPPINEKMLDQANNTANFLCDVVGSWSRIGLNERCIDNLESLLCSGIDLVSALATNASTNPSRAGDLQKHMWAADVLDAVGKFPSGFLDANVQWLGSYDQCEAITVDVEHRKTPNFTKSTVQGNYCKLYVPLPGSEGCAKPSGYITIGICMPHTCDNDDGKFILEKIHKVLGDDKVFCKLYMDCEKAPVIYYDLFAIGVMAFVALVILIATIGTAFDYFVFVPTMEHLPKSHDALLEEDASTITKAEYQYSVPFYWKAALCFSVYTNGRKILSTERREGTMECIHGIRVISMIWVMLGHVYYFMLGYMENPLVAGVLPTEFGWMAINNATVSVDTFFVMSGFLLSFLFLQRVQKLNGRPIKNARFWIMYYVHRYIRLTPTYMIVIALAYAAWSYIGDGPLYHLRDADGNGLLNYCPSSWWYNALYINNFLDFDKQCIGWTWYLANDMQFYWVSPILLVLFYYLPGVGVALALFLIAASSGIRVWLMHAYDLVPNGITVSAHPELWTGHGDGSTILYEKPYARIGTYAIGLLLGLIMHKWKGKVHWNSYKCIAIFGVTMALQWTAIYGCYNFAKTGVIDEPWASLSTAFNRVAWAITVAIIIFMCINDCAGPVNTLLSWNIWFPLSRLTYCAYLVHELVIAYLYSTLRKTEVFSHYKAAYTLCAVIAIAYGVAFVLSVMFEAPIMNLEKLLFEPAPRPRRPSKKEVVK